MRIGLIFPNRDRRYKTVHLGLGYLASYARSLYPDLEFNLLDTRVATRKETERFYSQNYDLVGITVFSPVYREVISVFNRIRRTQPQTPVCLGGAYVTTIMEEVLEETPAEFAIYGEGELTFADLLGHLRGEKKAGDINGLIYLNPEGRYVINPPREQIRDLDRLPMPAYGLFPMNRYPLHRVVTSRGCAYSCAWCNSSSIWEGKWRKREPGPVVAEIEFLIRNYGKKIFVFADNTFNVDRERAEAICDLLTGKDLRILWSASVRADLMTAELARKMKKAGCYNVSVGVESADNGILEAMGKRCTIEETARGIGYCREAGIEVLGQFVIGSPGDTLATVTRSMEWAEKAGLDYVNFYSVLPFRGTPQWTWVKEHGKLVTEKIHDFHSINPRIVFDTEAFPYRDRLAAIRLAGRKGFYSNQDKKNPLFDIAKEVSRKLQSWLPEGMGEAVFLFLKSIYRIRYVKKSNR